MFFFSQVFVSLICTSGVVPGLKKFFIILKCLLWYLRMFVHHQSWHLPKEIQFNISYKTQDQESKSFIQENDTPGLIYLW